VTALQPANLTNNSSFRGPLQIAWDSTSIGLLKECPRKYFLSIVHGVAPRSESVHLTFGILYHASLEAYDRAKALGASHDAATIEAVRYALVHSWDQRLKKPWISDDKYKNRETLVRSVAWYLDQFATDPMETIILANGKPAVELSFRIESGYYTQDGQPLLLCGHLDRLGRFNDQIWINDRKTTKSQINQDFFEKFSPDNQFSTYAFAGKITYGDQITGLIVDAAQIAVGFTRFQRGVVERTEAFLEEWHAELGYWLGQAESFAARGFWPANDKSCGNYGGCPFRSICSKNPSMRQAWMKGAFTQRMWDPLKNRGDF
jgi:hypothetical protein